MRYVLLGILASVALACGDDNDADALGVGAECTKTDDCYQEVTPPLQCITSFRGGYCGIANCATNANCPENSICVTHTDSVNYCFRSCTDKAQCNANRTTDNESNCSSNIVRTDGGNIKACVPPSS